MKIRGIIVTGQRNSVLQEKLLNIKYPITLLVYKAQFEVENGYDKFS
jgi:hypothetical protein